MFVERSVVLSMSLLLTPVQSSPQWLVVANLPTSVLTRVGTEEQSNSQGGTQSQTGNNPGGQAGNPSATGNSPGGQAGNSSAIGTNAGQADQQSATTASAGDVSADILLGTGATLSQGTTIQIELTRTLDAKRNKPNDEITARVTQDVKSYGHIVVRRGSKLIGHVTEIQARTAQNPESKLGIVFDRVILKDGSEISFAAVIQALAPATSRGSDHAGMAGGSAASGSHSGSMGGALGGVAGAATSTAGATVGGIGSSVGSIAGSTTGATGGATLDSSSRGVIGLQGLALSSVASGTTNARGSVVSSTTENVKLDRGTHMLLQVTQ